MIIGKLQIFLVVCAASLLFTGCADREVRMRSMRLRELVEDSRRGHTLIESPGFREAALTQQEVDDAIKYTEARKDHTCYHLLLMLRKGSLERYRAIPAVTRASILCSTLANTMFFNDWGHLGPGRRADGIAAEALVELGGVAIPYVMPLLDDERAAPHCGSWDATRSTIYEYRRCDYAYHLIARLSGLQPTFRISLAERDQEIAKLRARLRADDST